MLGGHLACRSVVDDSGILRGVPVLQVLGKRVALPDACFTFFVKQRKIVKTIGHIRKNTAVQALVRTVTPP